MKNKKKIRKAKHIKESQEGFDGLGPSINDVGN